MEAREAIASTFYQLVQRQSYNDINVSSICSETGISRKTFYRYFDAKDDVLKALIEQHFVIPVANVNNALPVMEIISSDVLLVEGTFSTFYTHRDFYSALILGPGEQAFREAFTKVMYDVNRHIYGTVAPASDSFSTLAFDEDELDFSSFFVAAAQTEVIIHWFKQGLKTPPKRMAKLAVQWVFAHWRELRGTIEGFTE